MKKITIYVLSMLLAATAAYTQSFPKDGKIYANGYGGLNSGTINALLTRIGSAEATLVCGAGDWAITNNVTIPANVRMEIPYGSTLAISTTIVFTVNGSFDAGVYTVFTGNGTAAGSATFPYRYTQWGDTNRYNIGTGQIQVDDKSISYILNEDPNADGESITNLTLVQAVSGVFDVVTVDDLYPTNIHGDPTFTGTPTWSSNDMAISYNGYPKVTLTTNSATRTGYGGGTAFTTTNVALTIDGSYTTSSTTNYLNDDDAEWVEFDLGNTYVGYLVMKAKVQAPNGDGQVSGGVMYSDGSMVTLGGTWKPSVEVETGAIRAYWSLSTNYATSAVSIPFTGRYVGYGFGVASSKTGNYSVHEFMVYGTTNNYRNITGAP